MQKHRWFSWATFALIITLVINLYQPVKTQAASFLDYKIEINKTTNRLYLYSGNSVVKTYKVATGRNSSLTPEGTFPMVVKIVKPGWKDIPGGVPENPLGERWNGLSVNGDNGRTYGIHGTNNPSSIGTHASSGCVRMLNSDVIDLYNRIYEGTPVWIHSGTSNNTWRGNSSVGLKPASGTLKVTANNLNARTGPSTGSFVITKLNSGMKLPLTGKAGDWYQVQLSNGRKAFVYKSYGVISGSNSGSGGSTGTTFTSASGTVQITVDVANVRSQPNLSSSVLTKASHGVKFTLTGTNSEWYRVKLSNGNTAYLHKTVASIVSTSSKVTVFVNVANIRSAPSLSATIIGKATKGTSFTKTGVTGDWHQVKLSNGKTAYLHKTVAR